MFIVSGYAFYKEELDVDFTETQKRADEDMYRNKLMLKSQRRY